MKMTPSDMTSDDVKSPRSYPAQDSDYDLRRWIGVFRRHIRVFLTITILVLIASVVAASLIKPIYSAGAAIQLDPHQRQSIDLTTPTPGEPPDSALIDTEVAVMKSHDVADGVVEQLGLVADKEFNPTATGRRSETAAQTLARVTKALQDHITVKREGVSYIVDIDARSIDPAKAARIANAMAAQYIAVSQRQRIAAAHAQEEALGGRASDLQARAESASAAVAHYKADAGIVGGGGSSGTVTDQQASTLAAQLSLASSDAAAANARASAAREQITKGNLDSVPEVLASPAIADLRRQRTEIVREQAEIDSRYLPRHPEFIRVANQLAQVDSQIRGEAERIVQGLESNATAASARAAMLKAQLGALEGRQAVNARASVEAEALQRRADELAAIATSTTQAVQHAAEQAQAGGAQGRIAALAQTPAKPSYPNKPLFAALGLFLGGLIGAATVFTMDYLNASVRTVEDVELWLGEGYLGSLPLAPRLYRRGARRVWDYVEKRPMSGFAEALRTIRSALKLGDKAARILTVTSALPREGKTSTAVSLARIMAMSGDRVLLIDCDLRRRTVHSLGPQVPAVGLVDVLTQGVPASQAIVRDSVDGLDILMLTNPAFTPADLFGGAAMTRLLDGLRAGYDHIIIDAPPVLAVADAQILASAADFVLMVVRWNKTPRSAVRAALSRLAEGGGAIAGVVLTMVDISDRAHIGESSPHYYYARFSKYYND
jgi:capsular exopolysaccharide synthesis family protein